MWIQELWSEVPNELIPFPWIHRFFSASSYRRLFVPAALSKVAELDSQSFFGEILPPFSGRGDFPETLQGMKLCHSNLRFTFAAGTIKHQATGRQNAVVQETDYVPLATPSFVFAEANQTKWAWLGNVFVKGHNDRADEIKKWAVITCNTEYPQRFPVCKWWQPFSLVRHQSGLFHSQSVSCIPTRL